jgi:hypothetical protein
LFTVFVENMTFFWIKIGMPWFPFDISMYMYYNPNWFISSIYLLSTFSFLWWIQRV